MAKKQLFRAAIANTLEFPAEIIEDIPRVIISGNKGLFLENHRGIVHYDAKRLTVRVNDGVVEILGDALVISLLKPDFLEIEGLIERVNYTVI